jgi:HEPN domain-containing protein
MTPRQQEKLYEKSYAQELISIAGGDYETALYLLEGMKKSLIRSENLFYLAQQSIEKSLKAVLCAYDRPIPMVHDLGILVAKLPEASNPQFGYEISRLNDFATTRRYEEGRLILDVEEAEDTLALAKLIFNWAQQIVISR